MEERLAKIIFAKPGGTASRGATSKRITLPSTWVNQMGITKENREVTLAFDGQEIVIKRRCEPCQN